MNRSIVFLLLGITGLIMPVNAWAVPSSKPLDNAAVAYLRTTVEKVLANNPEYKAAQVNIESAQVQLRGAGLPVYNPEFAIEIENADEKTYALGLAQTLDWYDKQGAQHAIQQIELQIAEHEKFHLAMALANDVLSAMADYYSAFEITQLHKQRTALLDKIVVIAKDRLTAGDINKSEVLLARISLADAVIEHANQKATTVEALRAFFALSQETISEETTFQVPMKDNFKGINISSLAQQHPLERISRLNIEKAKRQVILTRQESHADPEFGIKLRKEGDETLVGLQFSMPWQIRNNLSHTIEVAQKTQLQTELLAQNTRRLIIADIRAAKLQFKVTVKAWKIWLSDGQGQLKEHIELLDQLWKSGELSTTDYLVQLERNLHTQIAGVDLRGNLWRTWFQWLNATGQVLRWLNIKNEDVIEGAKQ